MITSIKRGQLIQFRVVESGKTFCSWDAIAHDSTKGHQLGARKRGPFLFGRTFPGDQIQPIPHGVRIIRNFKPGTLEIIA